MNYNSAQDQQPTSNQDALYSDKPNVWELELDKEDYSKSSLRKSDAAKGNWQTSNGAKL